MSSSWYQPYSFPFQQFHSWSSKNCACESEIREKEGWRERPSSRVLKMPARDILTAQVILLYQWFPLIIIYRNLFLSVDRSAHSWSYHVFPFLLSNTMLISIICISFYLSLKVERSWSVFPFRRGIAWQTCSDFIVSSTFHLFNLASAQVWMRQNDTQHSKLHRCKRLYRCNEVASMQTLNHRTFGLVHVLGSCFT